MLGNQLGESVEDIIEKMESYGKKDVLGPFDENEEPDSEDEEEEDEDEEEDEEEQQNGADATDDLALEIKGIGLSPDSKQLKQGDQSIDNVSQMPVAQWTCPSRLETNCPKQLLNNYS